MLCSRKVCSLRGWEWVDPRYVIFSDGILLGKKGKSIGNLDGAGYIRTTLMSSDNSLSKGQHLHRLVAQAFIPNPKNKPEVNHLDEVKNNNVLTNLEWVTAMENNNYGNRIAKCSSPVQGTHLITGETITFSSTSEAARNGFYRSEVSKCAAGRKESYKGYVWNYIKEKVEN